MLSVISSGGMDPTCSIMHSGYPQRDDLLKPVSVSTESFYTYYESGLRRQFTDSSTFSNHSALLGSVFVIRSPGFHLFCVSASGGDSANLQQDGVILLQFKKLGAGITQSCDSFVDKPLNASFGSSPLLQL
jgi:hypothetical protein